MESNQKSNVPPPHEREGRRRGRPLNYVMTRKAANYSFIGINASAEQHYQLGTGNHCISPPPEPNDS